MLRTAPLTSTALLALVLGAAMLSGCSGVTSALPAGPALGTTGPAAAPASGASFAATMSVAKSSSSPAAAVYRAAVMADSPGAYFPLNDASTALTDAVSGGASGTYGSSVVRGAAPITNGSTAAATFPGGAAYDPNGYAFTPVTAALQTPTVTVEAWIKLNASNTTTHDLPIAVYGTAARGVRYGLFLHGLKGGNNSLLYIQHNAGLAQARMLGSTRMTIGNIYHVVATFDGTTMTTYVNGNKEASQTYAGRIDYTSTLISDGLQLGGAHQIPQYASAQFPGTIAHVAVYGRALSATDVVSHFIDGQYVPMVTELPKASDAFVNSIGVNAHFENSSSNYATHFATVKSLLVASGIRHLREAMIFNQPWYYSNMQSLAAAGIKASYLTQGSLTQAQVVGFPNLVGNSFEQFEGLNEPDLSGNPNWAAITRAAQMNLYTWVKSNPRTAMYPVVGPALTGMSSSIAMGDLSAYMDYGNMHDYFGVFNPGTGGWGGYYPPYGCYGSISYNMNLSKLQSGSKPIYATETGYGTLAGNPKLLDDRAHLRYMTRLFFEQWNAGVLRSYSYEFLDEGGTNVFHNFGLVDPSLQPKPAYTGIKSIISALADPGTPFTPKAMAYNLTGFVNSVHHTLLQKRNGSYVLAVWLEEPAWLTTGGGGDIVNPDQTITLTTAHPFTSATMATMSDTGTLNSMPLSWNGTSATFNVSDKVSLITLTP